MATLRDSILATKDIEQSREALKNNPSYGAAVGLQAAIRIRNEHVEALRKGFKVVSDE